MSGGRRRPRRPHLDAAAPGELLASGLEAPVHESRERVLRRFERAAHGGLEGAGHRDDERALRLLAAAPIRGTGRIPYSSNAAFLLELEAPDPLLPAEPLRAVYKPARGERPLWDFPHRTLHLREVASYLVDAALGTGLIPPTALRDGPFGPGSVQLFVHPTERPPSDEDQERLGEQLRLLAALDILINNADRKSAHLLVGEGGRLHGIDNALTFLPYPRQRTVLLDLGGSPLPERFTAELRRLAADGDRRSALRRRLALLLSATEVRAFEARVDELAADPTYPILDPWDGRPFEWF